MWQTIQLLLGPDEHSKFLIEAVRRWDVKDPETGEVLPKILPRRCFPANPDKHMVAWYEGVSERLRTEAEEEIRKVEDEKEADRSRVALRGHDTDDEESVDSRGPALAYFRNPLYRHVDGKPSVVQHGPRRPAMSPRPSSLRGKSKEAATKFGHVMRNVASPHLWDGHERDPEQRHGSRTGSRDRDRERKRRSLPHHGPGDPPPQRDPYDEQLPPPGPVHARRHSRRRSSRLEPRPVLNHPGDDWEPDGRAPSAHSREPSPRPSSAHRSRPGPRDYDDPHLRHSRSHEPTPTQHDADDYFPPEQPAGRRRASAYEDSPDAPPRQPGFGPSFAPSAAPLFASHVARQPPQMPPNGPGREPPLPGPPPPPMNYDPRQYPGPPNRRPRPPHHPDMDGPRSRSRSRRHPSRSPQRSPPRRRSSRPRPPYDDRYPSPGRGPPPPGPRRRSRPPPGPSPRYGDPRDFSPEPRPEPHRRPRPPPGPRPGPDPRYDDPRDDLYSSDEESLPPPSPDDRRARRGSRRKSRGGRDDFDEIDGFHSAPEGPDRRGGPPRQKQTRFANEPMAGVDGRRYPDIPYR